MADSNYLPSNDAEFDLWQKKLVTYTTDPDNLARWGLTLAATNPVTSQQAVWDVKYPAMQTTKDAADVAMTGKKDSRLTYDPALRGWVGQLQNSPNFTDEDRREIDVTIAKTTSTPVGLPADAPDGEIDVSQRLRHKINFWDSATPGVKAKPAGVRGAQVYMKIGGEAPISPDECRYLATDTKTPYEHEFAMEEGGQMVYYLLCWENTKGETGPWSRVLSARVPQN